MQSDKQPPFSYELYLLNKTSFVNGGYAGNPNVPQLTWEKREPVQELRQKVQYAATAYREALRQFFCVLWQQGTLEDVAQDVLGLGYSYSGALHSLLAALEAQVWCSADAKELRVQLQWLQDMQCHTANLYRRFSSC